MSILKERTIWILLLLWLALLGLAIEVRADSAGFQGYITDLVNGEAISGAVVEAGEARVISDPRGRFVLRPGTGVYDVAVRAEGYIGMRKTRLRLAEGEQFEVNFEMIPQQPTAAQEAVLAEKLPRPQQEIAGTVTERALQGEVAASSVTQVPDTIRMLMPDGEVVVMNMDEYVKGVVPREVPPYWPEEALKAQAVAARSYASVIKAHLDQGADVCTTVHCQAWSNTHYDTTDQAVDDTHGVSVRYAGNIIYAFFFGHCDGRTRSSAEVWGVDVPYLQSVGCPCGFDELWGHGVGMCQEGAHALAEDGLPYDQILTHYYLGTQVEGPELAQLSDPVVMPEQGDEDTLFTFRVRYASPNGALPAVANLIVDGAAFPMLLLEEAADGSLFYSAQLPLALGEHSYRFSFDDGYGNLAVLPSSGTFQGPTVGSPGSGEQGAAPEFPALDEVSFGTRSDWEQGAMQGLHAVSGREGGIALNVGATQGIWTSPAVSFVVTPTALAAAWYGDTPAQSDISLAIRTKDTAEGAWSAWRALPVSEDDLVEAHVHRSRLAYGVGPICQLRLTLEAGTGAVSPLVWDLRVSALDTEEALPLNSASPLETGPDVVIRAEWGADEDLMRWEPVYRQPRVIVLHNTGMDLADSDSAAALRAEYLYSALIRGYGDIGYNYLVGPDGQIYEGRYGGPGVVGRHAGRYDWGSIGIALLGNYGGALPPTVETALVDLLTQLCREQGIDPQGETYFVDGTFPNLMTHSELGATSCPGAGLQGQMDDIRAQVAARLAPPPGVSFFSPPAGSAVRAVVQPGFDVTGTVTRTRFYVDGQLDWSSAEGALDWRWNTTAVSDGLHTISVTACNDNGCAGAERSLLVDNLAPTGSVTVTTWVTDTLVPFAVDSEDVVTVQFSNGWVWEGESLYHTEGSGGAVVDA
ncbi:MAG: SpoIID/LytB domain-containing protein, partial [Anaerolineae bacterium]|nr:SpoIID/LytB domain-containing protein [Anaerolineae bacterium]